MPNLDKVLNSWKHVIDSSGGQMNKEVEKHIMETIKLLEELKIKRVNSNA